MSRKWSIGPGRENWIKFAQTASDEEVAEAILAAAEMLVERTRAQQSGEAGDDGGASYGTQNRRRRI